LIGFSHLVGTLYALSFTAFKFLEDAALVFTDGSKIPSKRRDPPSVSFQSAMPVNAASRSVRLSACSPQTRRNGLAVVVDATRSAWRMTRACIRQVGVVLGADAAAIIVLRPEAFWDKQRVDNCARIRKEGEVRRSGGGGHVVVKLRVIRRMESGGTDPLILTLGMRWRLAVPRNTPQPFVIGGEDGWALGPIWTVHGGDTMCCY
jgi:hypothetical protein